MPTLQASTVADLVKASQKELGKFKWTDLTTDLQYHIAMPKLLKQNKIVFGGGTGSQWTVLMDHNHSAKHVGLLEEDDVNIGDGAVQAYVEWRHCTASYAVEEHMVTMNQGPGQIFDYIKEQRFMAKVALAEELERAVWSCPATTNTKDIYGIPYWITKSATSGFYGTVPDSPSGYTTIANINPTTYPRWRNWTDDYTAVTKADVITKMREAYVKTDFRSPVEHASYSTGDKYGIYLNYATLSDFEEVGEAQNENLGRDVASMDGTMTFRKIPLQYVPYLDNDADNPIYGINWGDFKLAFLKGWYLKESEPIRAANQHTTWQVFFDLTWNMRCTNRRRQWVLYVN